ncbi:class I SAM-dependent methyltransferase [Sinimarinibacterium flocculans]|uniref:Methyltransferase family protein n=1 Tax=Sinimarinibacterium flocculans TaxID=985250 RepID=A0A318EG28_9GAMM|nr:class I SAM-dependent methyltransferase [Sinimarinibacterium flocculans]PXV69755.1 methyltransferase family protein [Sinimarinibacterium flocculans]
MDPKARADVDLAEHVQALLGRQQSLSTALRVPMVTTVSKGDGMYSGDSEYYLQAGASALSLLFQSLEAAGTRRADVGAVLDYACGFGRVTRWLAACFPGMVHAADLDPSAVDAVGKLIGVPTTHIAKDLSVRLLGSYDLIWVGSLLTHLNEADIVEVLRYLGGHLTSRGLLVVTTHGPYVAERLRSREKTYNLEETAVAALVERYDAQGSAFAAYRGMTDYGISLTRPHRLATMAFDAGLDTVYFKARGWVKHQDCFCLRKT